MTHPGVGTASSARFRSVLSRLGISQESKMQKPQEGPRYDQASKARPVKPQLQGGKQHVAEKALTDRSEPGQAAETAATRVETRSVDAPNQTPTSPE